MKKGNVIQSILNIVLKAIMIAIYMVGKFFEYILVEINTFLKQRIDA